MRLVRSIFSIEVPLSEWYWHLMQIQQCARSAFQTERYRSYWDFRFRKFFQALCPVLMSCPPLRRYHEFWEGRDHALVFLRACHVILYQSTPNFLLRPNTIPKDHSKAVVRHFSHAFLLFIKFRCFQTSYISCIAPLKVHPTLSPQVKYPPFFLVSLIVFPVSLTICIAYWMS